MTAFSLLKIAKNTLKGQTQEEADTPSDALIHIENSLNLIRKEGAWFITDVIGGQTTIDFLIADEIVPSSASSP